MPDAISPRLDVPRIVSPDPAAQQALDRTQQELRRLMGYQGDPLDMAVTYRDMLNAGMLTLNTVARPGSGRPPGTLIPPAPSPSAPAPAPGPAPPPAPYEPDLTPPPTPSGVTVTAGMDFVFITTGAPTFSEGHGYHRTVVYGAIYSGSGPLPTFANAQIVHEFVGQVGSFPTPPGTRWHIWVKWRTVDGIESVAPDGGVNGRQAYASYIGNVHLGPLIVEAGNLADGTVTAAKLANQAVTLTAFAAGIRPVRVLGVLPTLPASGYTDGDTAVLTTDGKLYRIVGGAWTRAVDGGDIIANSITAGSIAAGAIGATQIAAEAIRTSHLLVTGRGAALNADPMATDTSAWTVLSGSGLVFATGITNIPVGGSTALANTSGLQVRPFSVEMIEIDSTKNYRLEAWLRTASGTPASGNYFAVAWYDAAGVFLQSNVAQPTGAGSPAGWDSNGTYSYVATNVTVPTTWTRYSSSFGPSEQAQIPSNARFARIGVLLNNSLSGQVVQATGIRLMEKAAADLIVDGSIVASKLAANAIAVGTAAIQNGAIVNAMIANATITDAKIVDLSVSKLRAGSLLVGEWIQSSAFTPGGVGFRIDGGGGAEFRFSGGTRVFHLGASGTQPILRAPGLEILANGSATYSGALSAATGTFAGSLSAATGTFSGAISGSSFTGGTVTGALIQTAATGKRVVLNESGSNEARFYGDRGDGTIELLASIGINTAGSDAVVGLFGGTLSSRWGVWGRSNTGIGVHGSSNSNFGVSGSSIDSYGVLGSSVNNHGIYGSGLANNRAGVFGISSASVNGWGVLGASTFSGAVRGESGFGNGVEGTSNSGHGGHFTGNSSRSPLFLTPQASPPTAVAGSVAIITTPIGPCLCFSAGGQWYRVSASLVAYNAPDPGGGG